MSDIEIRDDRAAGRLEAVAGDEVVGHIEYFVLESPSRAGCDVVSRRTKETQRGGRSSVRLAPPRAGGGG
ncbi:hypothetical protein ACFV23_14735, partial [Streptomyces sp. NPDC059627]